MLQESWASPTPLPTDPSRSFAFAWKHLRNKYKKIQDNAKQTNDPLDSMYEKLAQLKLDILDESLLFQREEFQELRAQIRENELTEATRLCSLCIAQRKIATQMDAPTPIGQQWSNRRQE